MSHNTDWNQGKPLEAGGEPRGGNVHQEINLPRSSQGSLSPQMRLHFKHLCHLKNVRLFSRPCKQKAGGVNISSSSIVSCWWISPASLCVCFRLRGSLWIVWKASCLVFPLSSPGICLGFWAFSIAGAQGRRSPASQPATPLPHFPWVGNGAGRCLQRWWRKESVSEVQQDLCGLSQQLCAGDKLLLSTVSQVSGLEGPQGCWDPASCKVFPPKGF